MKELRRLAHMLKELEERLIVCMRCGFCQAHCPLYGQTGLEMDVARGKLALLDGLAKEMVKDPQGVKKRLERCLLCGSCAAGCPSGVETQEIFLKGRAILSTYLGLPPLKKLIFRLVLAHPFVFNLLLSWARPAQAIMARPVSELLQTSCGRIAWPLGRRHFKRLAPLPFHRQIPPARQRSGASGPRAALFIGCLIDQIFPQVGLAVLKVMDHHGVTLVIPSGQACCGMPALSGGDSRTFHHLLAHNLKLFDPDDFDYLITACATCTATIKKNWPLMAKELSPKQQERVSRLAAKTRDISQFLAEAGLLEQTPPPQAADALAVTYHDPCHLKKSLGVSAQPRQALAQSPGYHLVEMPEADWCCGLGGSFNLEHYDLSKEIGQRKLANIERTACRVVATSCPACMLQITDALSQAGKDIQVRHVIELYAQGL